MLNVRGIENEQGKNLSFKISFVNQLTMKINSFFQGDGRGKGKKNPPTRGTILSSNPPLIFFSFFPSGIWSGRLNRNTGYSLQRKVGSWGRKHDVAKEGENTDRSTGTNRKNGPPQARRQEELSGDRSTY